MPRMDKDLLQAAMSGDSSKMQKMAERCLDVLLAKTPGQQAGNTCLHIASIHGHRGFCSAVLDKNGSLITAVNEEGETPLLTAITRGHVSLALDFIRFCRSNQIYRDAILCQDKHGCNALHHAIRSGHKDLAKLLIEVEPGLSKAVNVYHESPMFIAVMRDYEDITKALLEIPESARGGAYRFNALHAAVRNGNSDIAKMIIGKHPELSREENYYGNTAVEQAVLLNKIDVLKVLLEHDWSLGYSGPSSGSPLLVSAARRGHVGVAQELLNHCPDAPYLDRIHGWTTCLHEAVKSGHTEFVEFVMRSQQLRNKLVNLRDLEGRTALHHAVKKCNPRILQALLLNHTTTDFTMISGDGKEASSGLLIEKEPPNKI